MTDQTLREYERQVQRWIKATLRRQIRHTLERLAKAPVSSQIISTPEKDPSK